LWILVAIMPTLSQRSDKECRVAKEAKGKPIEAVMDLIPIKSLDMVEA
jgi:hypothetical protein